MTSLTDFVKKFPWQSFYMILQVLEFSFSGSTWVRGIFKNSLNFSVFVNLTPVLWL